MTTSMLQNMGATDLGSTDGGISALAVRLDRNWHPTGFYTPEDVANIIKQLGAVFVQVRTPLADFEKKLNYIPFMRNSYLTRGAAAEIARIDAAWSRATTVYLGAATTAKMKGIKYLDAPGLKQFVVGFLKAMGIAAGRYRELAAEFNRIAEPSWIDKIGNFFTSFGATIKAIVVTTGEVIMKVGGVAVDVAKAAGGALMKIPDTISTVFKVLKWTALLTGGAVLAFGGYVTYKRVKESPTYRRLRSGKAVDAEPTDAAPV